VLYVPCPILFILCVYNFVSVVSTVYLSSSLLHKQTTELLKRGHAYNIAAGSRRYAEYSGSLVGSLKLGLRERSGRTRPKRDGRAAYTIYAIIR